MLLSSMVTSTFAVPDTALAIPKKGFLSPRLSLILKAISPHQIKLAPHRDLLNRLRDTVIDADQRNRAFSRVHFSNPQQSAEGLFFTEADV
jgi:hypothetical protein